MSSALKEAFSGGKGYWSWILILIFFIFVGLATFTNQLEEGLALTGMTDQVSWGFYVANFTFLVGMAAAAVMLIIPAYIFNNLDARRVVLLGEGLAVAASLMCMLFVLVDMGRPERLLHMIPGIGQLNWPDSLLAWDILVLTGYLLLNLLIPGYILYHRFHGLEYNKKLIFVAVLISIFWAFSIHTVTAFLFASNTGRYFWHTALLAPRFLASAFTAGPAFIILAFFTINRVSPYKIGHQSIQLLAVITTIAMQINLLMLGAELFTEFYGEGQHSASARYLFFGLQGLDSLVFWIYFAIFCNISAVLLLMIRKTRQKQLTLMIACIFAVIGVWLEKGIGFVIPGFIPTPIGEVFEYAPTFLEIKISLGIWGIGLLVFTLLIKATLPIQRGTLHGKALD